MITLIKCFISGAKLLLSETYLAVRQEKIVVTQKMCHFQSGSSFVLTIHVIKSGTVKHLLAWLAVKLVGLQLSEIELHT